MIHRIAMFSLAAAGTCLLLAAQMLPWMRVPVDIVRDGTGAARCITAQPADTWAFQAACMAVLLILAGGHLWHHRTSHRKAWVAGILIAMLATYPFAAMTLDAALSAEAAWLTIQHENLVWLGGDLHTNLEAGRAAWKDQVYIVDTPRQVSVIQMPTSQLGAFRFGRLMNWMETLGYSNRFCQFVGRGWLMAVAGALALACAECMPGGTLSRGRVMETTLAAGASLGMLIAAAAIVILLSTRSLDRSRGAIARGLYDVGAQRLDRAARYLPCLREDTFFAAQSGLLAHRLCKRSTLAGRLFEANLLERQGRYAEALDMYERLVADAPPRSAVRREAIRATLREGIHALNGNRTQLAVMLLESVLRAEPCSIKANYALQLAYLRIGRRTDLEKLVADLDAVYRCFQMPTKAIVLSSSYENCVLAACREHDIEAVVRYSRKAQRP